VLPERCFGSDGGTCFSRSDLKDAMAPFWPEARRCLSPQDNPPSSVGVTLVFGKGGKIESARLEKIESLDARVQKCMEAALSRVSVKNVLCPQPFVCTGHYTHKF